MSKRQQKIRERLPGLLATFGIALLADGAAHWIPLIGAPALALLLGLILGNTLVKAPILSSGTRFAEGNLLEYSIILLGASLTFVSFQQIGAVGLLFIVTQMGITIIAALFIGRRLQFSFASSALMAAGNGICGSSAIAATAPIVAASSQERGLSIAIVNLMGTVMMFLLPLIAWKLFSGDLDASSALIGGALQSVGQVVGAASLLGAPYIDGALLIKIIRVIGIVPVVLLFTYRQQNIAHPPTPTELNHDKGNKTGTFLRLIPWYIYGFLLLLLLNSIALIPTEIIPLLTDVRNLFEVMALAAIGLRLNFALLKQQGGRYLRYALLLGGVQLLSIITLTALFVG